MRGELFSIHNTFVTAVAFAATRAAPQLPARRFRADRPDENIAAAKAS